MMKKIITHNPLFFAFIFPALVDATLTLIGQEKEYWQYRIVNEASPAYYFLFISPWLFIFGSIIWFIVLSLLFKKLKEPLNIFLMFLFLIGHSWGSSSWLRKILRENNIYNLDSQLSIMFGWFLIILYFILISLFATYCLKIYLSKNMKKLIFDQKKTEKIAWFALNNLPKNLAFGTKEVLEKIKS